MAYAALISLAQIIDKILNDYDKYPIYPHGNQPLKTTHENIVTLKRFLEEFSEKANSNLEGRIRDVAEEAEDITEHVMWKQIRRYNILQSTARPESAKRWLHSDVRKLKKILKQIDSIAGEVLEIKNSARADQDLQPSGSSFATSSSRLAPTSKDAMVGFDDDLMEIKTRLCGESSKLIVIPIFGMGGIGKTTLARNAFDDPLTMEYFNVRAWVTVSQHYSPQEILSGVLFSVREERSERSNESMDERVYKRLKGRRYLIVIDDIWSKKVWDDVKMIFPDDHNGSRIILTTRLADVAIYPESSSHLHEMRFMDEDQSWKLLQQKVFARENCPPELETIGKVIAKSCRGLPLAIVLIAGLLSTVSKTQASWAKIAENVKLAISTTNHEHFAKILSLSYIHLPHYLRPCFLYIGGFPEDYEICVSKLIKLWVAEGFLEPSRSKSFEEVAEAYLEDLVKRSLVLVIKRKTNGKIKSCSLHDLVRDLCIRKTLSRVNDFKCTEQILKMIPNLKKLGIFYCTKECFQESRLDNLVYLRQLEKLKLEVLNAFGNLQGKFNPVFPTMLKKLTLSGWRLPWEDMGIVGSLPNLQVLKLIGEAFFGEKWETSEGEFHQLKFLLIDRSDLEQWITESNHFPSLKYLVIYHCWNLIEIPDGIGEIPTLELIEVEKWNKPLVESAMRIQEEQRSWGNDALNVRVVD